MLRSLFQFSAICTVDVARTKTEFGTLLRCRNSTAGNNLPWKKPLFPSSFFYISFSSWSLKTGAVIHDWTLNIYDGWCLCLETTLCTSACKALPLRNQVEIRSYNTLADYRSKYYGCLNYSLEFNYSVHFHICNYSEMKLDSYKCVLYIEMLKKKKKSIKKGCHLGTNMPESHVLPVLPRFLGCDSCSGHIWKKLPVIQKGEHARASLAMPGRKSGQGHGKKWCLSTNKPYCSFIWLIQVLKRKWTANNSHPHESAACRMITVTGLYTPLLVYKPFSLLRYPYLPAKELTSLISAV